MTVTPVARETLPLPDAYPVGMRLPRSINSIGYRLGRSSLINGGRGGPPSRGARPTRSAKSSRMSANAFDLLLNWCGWVLPLRFHTVLSKYPTVAALFCGASIVDVLLFAKLDCRWS